MWTLILSACLGLVLTMSLAFCLCWRRKSPKNEWMGVDGMVIQKNPDENVNHLSATVVDGITDSEKRSTMNNSRRSLPDIPAPIEPNVNWGPGGDNSSEHYATLSQYQNAAKGLTNNHQARSSVSPNSSISQATDTFSPYERVKYDKIKSTEVEEHPYAQVQPSTSRQVTQPDGGNEERLKNNIQRQSNIMLRVDSASPSNGPTIRTSSHGSVGTGLDIPAAPAVAGEVAASPDLPYMTPPVVQPQQNFSGDSQDSSKGYTSISVREPLANIIGKKKEMLKSKREMDPHYATVSDDSDDVYTTIPDPNNQIYTSESETYARIPALSGVVNLEPKEPSINTSNPEVEEVYEQPHQPAPPSVDSLKQFTHHTHSRQASTSSSVANLGSPKPEKRQANSPLPPPPIVGHDLQLDKLQGPQNLEELYAKIHKTHKKDQAVDESLTEREVILNEIRKSLIVAESSGSTLARKVSDPGYEKIKGSADCEPGYASINGPESIASSSDPGYEVLRDTHLQNMGNYDLPGCRESVSAKMKADINAGYSVIKKKNPITAAVPNVDAYVEEPNYESMPSESEPNYNTIPGSNGSDTDPNYESVSQSDPNYESVKDLELPYERLEEASSKSNSELSGYEKIKEKSSSDSSNRTIDSEPPYERLSNDGGYAEVPGYERVGGSEMPPVGFKSHVMTDDGVSDSDIADLHKEDGIVEV